MQFDLFPELTPSGGTAMDVSFKLLVAYTTMNQLAKAVARVIINILTKHA